MQITRAADYAVRLMLHLAATPDGKRASRRELARASDAPLAFVAKLLQRLSSAGLVRPQPGRGGGFVLARGRETISMLHIVAAIDGDLCMNRCLPPLNDCHRLGWCPAHTVWGDAQQAVGKVLASATLDLLAARMIAARAAAAAATPINAVPLVRIQA
jgi:Rrf2 family protein